MIFSFWQEHLDEFLESMCEQGFCPIVIATHKRFAQSVGNLWIEKASVKLISTFLNDKSEFLQYQEKGADFSKVLII